MKLLLDQNISRKIVKRLQDIYPDSSQAFLLNMSEADDHTIWQYAKDNEFVIVTKDSDFYEFSLVYGQPPKIIWLKCGNQSNQYILNTLLNHHDEVSDFSNDNASVCLEIY